MKQSEKPIEKEIKMDKLEVASGVSEAIGASKATLYTGGAVSAVAWWQSIDWLAFGGVLLAVAGLLLNFFFSYRKDKREQEEHRARMKKYEDQ